MDLFSYVYQDFLPVFAAGNLGYEEVDSTVTSPSVAKNCLSVGKPEACVCHILHTTLYIHCLWLCKQFKGCACEVVVYRKHNLCSVHDMCVMLSVRWLLCSCASRLCVLFFTRNSSNLFASKRCYALAQTAAFYFNTLTSATYSCHICA